MSNNNNGRIDLFKLTDTKFLMQDKIPVHDTVSNYSEALNGIYQCSDLSNMFFRKENIIEIQRMLSKKVLECTKKQIDPQDPNIIKGVMRSTFLHFSKNLPNNISEQITELNNLVVKQCVPRVISGINSYLKYQRDVSNLAVPMDLPKSTYRNQTIEFKGYFEKNDPKKVENNNISKFFNNNVEIAKNFKPLI
jgi:hypothetical protein